MTGSETKSSRIPKFNRPKMSDKIPTEKDMPAVIKAGGTGDSNSLNDTKTAPVKTPTIEVGPVLMSARCK